MSNDKTKWEDINFPRVKNIQAKTLADSIEGIPTEDMPKRMAEMFASVHNLALETIHEELNEIRGVEGKEDRVKYLEELLATWFPTK
jgi:hypothetical protein